jgi:hypothetical protein
LSACALVAGLVVVGVELSRAPRAVVGAAAIYAAVWVVRGHRARSRRTSRRWHRVRREVLTNTVIAALVVALGALAIAAAAVSTEIVPPPGQAAAAPADDTPWAATFLVDGLITTVALSWLLLGARGLLRGEHRRGSHAPQEVRGRDPVTAESAPEVSAAVRAAGSAPRLQHASHTARRTSRR